MIKALLSGMAFVCLSACGQTNSKPRQQEPKAYKCDDPDAPISCSFVDMPSNTGHIMNIPVTTGTKMLITGVIRKSDGSPYPGVVLYAYHTDDKGIYSKNGNETGAHKWHGSHHGWAVTNDKGEYQIHSIRPAKYPNSNGPAHIHAAIKTPENRVFWISDFVFKDDPAVTENYTSRNPGGSGVVDINFTNGQWQGVREIELSSGK